MLGGFIGGWEIILILATCFIVPLVICLFAFWIWMLIDCIKNDGLTGNEKIAWILVIVFTHWLGALIYFLAARPKRPALESDLKTRA